MVDLQDKLSPSFTIGEWLRSQTAERDADLKRKQYNPSPEVLVAGRYLFKKTIQPARDYFGVPIYVSSGYRCPELNERVGGSSSSQHVVGEAADLHLSSAFLFKPECTMAKRYLQAQVEDLAGGRGNVDWSLASTDFYLFLYFALRLHTCDVDQVIHEFGAGHGRPAWVHVSSSSRQDRRRITYVGSYTRGAYMDFELKEAFEEWPLVEKSA